MHIFSHLEIMFPEENRILAEKMCVYGYTEVRVQHERSSSSSVFEVSEQRSSHCNLHLGFS